jgi:hypothetical protein
MAINVRTKGKCGERDVVKMLATAFPQRDFKRNLREQAADGGVDILVEPAGKWAIEVKRCKAYRHEWWRQAVAQGKRTNKLPVLIYRLDRHAWQAEVPLSALTGDVAGREVKVTMPLEAWIVHVSAYGASDGK